MHCLWYLHGKFAVSYNDIQFYDKIHNINFQLIKE